MRERDLRTQSPELHCRYLISGEHALFKAQGCLWCSNSAFRFHLLSISLSQVFLRENIIIFWTRVVCFPSSYFSFSSFSFLYHCSPFLCLPFPACPSMPVPNPQIKHSAIKQVALTLSETKECEVGTSRRWMGWKGSCFSVKAVCRLRQTTLH